MLDLPSRCWVSRSAAGSVGIEVTSSLANPRYDFDSKALNRVSTKAGVAIFKNTSRTRIEHLLANKSSIEMFKVLYVTFVQEIFKLRQHQWLQLWHRLVMLQESNNVVSQHSRVGFAAIQLMFEYVITFDSLSTLTHFRLQRRSIVVYIDSNSTMRYAFKAFWEGSSNCIVIGSSGRLFSQNLRPNVSCYLRVKSSLVFFCWNGRINNCATVTY